MLIYRTTKPKSALVWYNIKVPPRCANSRGDGRNLREGFDMSSVPPANIPCQVQKAFGVYQITNTITGDLYIGSTIRNFRDRWLSHRSDLRRQKHHNQRLQRAWNKYGEQAFAFSVVEVVTDKAYIIEAEQRWLDVHYGKPSCYNFFPQARSGGGISHDWNAKTYPGFRAPDGTEYHNVHNLKRFCREHGIHFSAMWYLLAGEYRQFNGWTLLSSAPFVKKVYYFISPDGTAYEVDNLAQFCRKMGLHHESHMSAVAQGRRRSYRGWTRDLKIARQLSFDLEGEQK
jgi:hypothetical protein